MLWRSDTRRVTVLYNDHTSVELPDQWDGEPYGSTGSPPPGKVAPVRGFGWIWLQHDEIRQKLGWGLDEEKGCCVLLQTFEHGSVLRSVKGSCGSEFNRANEGDFEHFFIVIDAERWNTL